MTPNAWRVHFDLNFVFTVQWFSLGVMALSHLNWALGFTIISELGELMKNSKKAYGALLFIALFAVLAISATVYIYFEIIKQEPIIYGSVGDFLGGVLNPVLSFLGLIALLLTLCLQHQQLEVAQSELQLSRKELAETRMELSRSAKAQEETSQHQLRQVRIQELTTRLSAIERLLSIDGAILTQLLPGEGYSSTKIDIKEYSGERKEDLYKELGNIYKELSRV